MWRAKGELPKAAAAGTLLPTARGNETFLVSSIWPYFPL